MNAETVEDVELAIQKLVAENLNGLDVWDDEGAHIDEDEIYEAVLRSIASGNGNAQQLATAALKLKDLDFSRWYA